MNDQLLTKKVLINSANLSIDNAAFTLAGVVDCQGWRHCAIDFVFGNLPAAITAMTVRNSDLSNMGSSTTLVDFNSGTDIAGSALVLPAATKDRKVYRVEIDLLGKKRYIDATLTAGDGSNVRSECAVIATLSRGEIGPLTAAQRGCEAIARV